MSLQTTPAVLDERNPSEGHRNEGHPLLTNADLAPTPTEQRRWTWWHFSALWMGMVHNIYNFTWIGGLVALGMSVEQALVIALVGNLIQTVVIGLNGRVGARHGIPFAVWARTAFGVFGANIPAVLRGLIAIGWFGIQSYLAATAINLLLTTAIPAWHHLDGHGWLGMSPAMWITMVVYWAINFLVTRHGMETVRRFESWAGPAIFVVMLGLLIWSVVHAGGTGHIISQHSRFHSTGDYLTKGFFPALALYISGSWAAMCLNIPDLTRFARSNRDQFWGTMIGLPLASLVYFGMVGIIVSATETVFGKAYWNPTDVISAINNPVFSIFGALLLALATLSVNIPANLVSPAYDLTNLFPKWMNFRRASYIAMVIAFVYMPWKLMQSPTTLYNVLDNIGVVIGPITGILIADYYLVRRQRIDVAELYRVTGRYRSTKGFNLVGLGVLAAGVGLSLAGEETPGIHGLYQYSWFVGLAFGFVVYLGVTAAVCRLRASAPAEFAPAGDLGQEARSIAS